MRLKTVLVTALIGLPFCLCVASSAFSTEPTPSPRRVSALGATTMELKLYQDIKDAPRSGRDTTAAEKLKAKGDAELKEGRIRAAKRHYSEAEKALGATK